MERFVTGPAVLGALLLAHVVVSEAQTVEKYFKADGELQLSPVPVSEKITSVVWKYDKNLLGEWMEDLIKLTFYSKFEGRSNLNITTGVLVVRGVTTGDNGQYSVEINNRLQSQSYQVVVIQEVPKPTVDLQPLVCAEQCSLACLGEIAKAEPVEYFWKKGGGEWEAGQKNMAITYEETKQEETFSCRMKNPVSEKVSEPFKLPVHQENSGASAAPVVIAVVAVVVVLIVVVILYFLVPPFKTWVHGCFRRQEEAAPPEVHNNGERDALNLKETPPAGSP